MSSRITLVSILSILVLSGASSLVVANRNFVPDWTFKGSSLTGLRTIGHAEWKASNGEIVGTPTSPDGGWLLLDKSLQDLQFAANVRCTPDCIAGVMVRAEQTPTGIKGAFVPFGKTETAAFAMTLDRDGRELTREPLGRAGGMVRVAAAPGATGRAAGPGGAGGFGGAAAGAAPAPGARGGAEAAGPPAAGRAGAAAGGARAGGAARGGPGGPAGALPDNAPYTRPTYTYKPGEWNPLEILLDTNNMRVWFNDGPENGVTTGRVDDDITRYGSIALYVGGSGEVRFKDVELKDLSKHELPKETVGAGFRMQRLNDWYYAWSASAGDINHDGIMDIVAGPFYWLGPSFEEAHEIYVSQTSNVSNQYTPAMVNFVYDYTGDGWPDVLVTESRPLVLYVNPRGEPRRWDRFPVVPVSSETIVFKDVDGDGKPDPVYIGGGTVNYATPDPADATKPWTVHVVSGPGFGTNAQHGVGVGDINGDKRMDIVTPYGWWEQPAQRDSGPWPYHPVAFGRWPRAGGSPGGGEMAIYDVNGDGLNDVVAALEAHGWGLAWFEQKKDAAGAISFVEHMIMDDYSTKNSGDVTFSELHASTSADVNGDGIPDFIVGKRVFAHNESYNDPDPYGPAVLYWYETVRDPKAPGGARFVPHLIHNRSGVGSALAAVDVNKDGAVDILTSTNRGTFVFFGTPKGGARGRGSR
jgi:hypothetical protein